MSAQIVRATGLTSFIGLLAAIALCGCGSRQSPGNHPIQGTAAPPDAESGLVVHPSATGWSLRVAADGSTIVVNPRAKEFLVGATVYPNRTPTTLWRVDVPRLGREFLVVFAAPMASGAMTMTLFTIRQDGETIVRAADILHHYEWKAEYTTADNVREALFVDSDGDGIPELVDDDVWKWGGALTYYVLVGDRFQPRWRETYELDEATARVVLTRRESVQK